jgi:ADP-ribose pyrophosphatase
MCLQRCWQVSAPTGRPAKICNPPEALVHNAGMTQPEIRTTASQIVYRNRWMAVREDAIERADGSTGIYGVVEKPDFAVIAALREGQLYLVEQYRYPVRQRFWELPQGSWEGQTIDPLSLARAELREETGLVAGHMQHAGRLFLGYGYSTQAYDLFLAIDCEQHATELDAEELGLVARPFDIATVQTMVCDGSIQDATTVAAFGLLRLKGLI